MDIGRALRSDRLMKALTGFSGKEFFAFVDDFDHSWDTLAVKRYRRGVGRQRKPGGGRTGELKTVEVKLFFILFYVKCYPTFDLLGFLFGFDRSNGCRNAHKLLPLLEKTLGHNVMLPERKVHTLEELMECIPEVNELFLDGTERPVQRPKKQDKQKDHYSGKKKRHTVKNTLITDEKKRIHYLGPTVPGHTHDYGTFKDEFQKEPPPADMPPLYADLGYLGIEKDYPGIPVIMPKKKPKGQELSVQEKAENKKKSSVRVKVEHAIGGAKRYRIVTDVFRNKTKNLNDTCMALACGLWNYHLSQT